MDAFKILSRSTKIKTASKNAKPALGATPSSGRVQNPQLFPTSDSWVAGNGRKRKRDGSDVESDTEDPSHLNFFLSLKPGDVEDVHPKKSSSNRAPHAAKKEDEQFLPRPPSLPEEECRSVLKRHKIKIMDLGGSGMQSAEMPATSNSKKAKKRSQVAPKNILSKKKQRAASSVYPQPVVSFAELRPRFNISKVLDANIRGQGYTLPTEVQLGTLPLLMKLDTSSVSEDDGMPDQQGLSISSLDLLTIAPTGSGKTLAFLLPLIHSIQHRRPKSSSRQISAIIVAPTKELVTQTVNEGRKLTASTGVRVTAMRKGMKLSTDGADQQDAVDDEASISDLAEGSNAGSRKQPIVTSDILVTTPLQLVNALSREEGQRLQLPSVRYLVLDEADVLLDPLFREQTMGIWNACSHPDLRVSLWSATMGSNIEELAQATISRRRDMLDLSEKTPLIRVVVGLKDSAIPNVSHKLVYAATEPGKLMGLRQLLHPTSTHDDTAPRLRPPFLVFTQTIPRAVALNAELAYDIPAEAGGKSRIAVLHSDLSDTQRSDIMARFRKGEIWVLITTDLLSRGVDFRGINGVVNYDIPNSSAAYVHRVGRTGRAGRSGGVAVTFYTKEDIPYVKNIANVIAASEKQRGKGDEEGMQKWLLDALPNLSKKDKKELKHKGVDVRRTASGNEGDNKAKRKSRISTKSGYDRQLEHNRKGAIQGGQIREEDPDDESEEWAGFAD